MTLSISEIAKYVVEQGIDRDREEMLEDAGIMGSWYKALVPEGANICYILDGYMEEYEKVCCVGIEQRPTASGLYDGRRVNIWHVDNMSIFWVGSDGRADEGWFVYLKL